MRYIPCLGGLTSPYRLSITIFLSFPAKLRSQHHTVGPPPALEGVRGTEDVGGEGEGGGKSRLELLRLLKQQRDYKRRRQSYRAKNVSITQRTITEVRESSKVCSSCYIVPSSHFVVRGVTLVPCNQRVGTLTCGY